MQCDGSPQRTAPETMALSLVNKRFPRLNAAANALYRGARLYCSNSSARAWRVLLAHVSRRAFDRSVPTWINIALTYRCQCRCVHCYAYGREAQAESELPTELIKSLIDQAREMGVLQVGFTGGEALLRDDLAELVSHAHDLGLITRLNTNGVLLTRERVAELSKAGLTHCGVSIDDADPEVHDRLRRYPGCHEKALEGIANLRESGILSEMMTYASRRIIASGLDQIVALGKRIGASSVCLFFPTALGRWADAADELLDEEEKARVRALRDLTLVHVPVLPAPTSVCRVLTRDIMHVSAYGDLTPCPRVPYVIGNVRDHPLAELWERFCNGLCVECRGDCVINVPEHAAALREHIESVALGDRTRQSV